MPRRRSTEPVPTQIVDAVFAAIDKSGGIAADEGESDRLPLRLDVEYDGDGHRMWIYVWPLVRDPSLPGRMYRLQTAEIPSIIEWHPDDIVLVLGYEADLDVFIGYGLGGKQGPEPPIFETAVDVSLFHRALQDGLSFGKWTNRFFIGANVDIQIQVKGVDEFLKNLRDLGVNRIPNYVARALTGIADQAQDAMMGNARSMLTIRGNWLVKGYKYGINRKQAYKMRGRRVPETGQGSACDL